MEIEQEPESGPSRYVPLLVNLGVILSLFLIPFLVIRLGFMPPDDALRHVAKVLSGKDWSEIMVMREGITIDHNAGWHAILGAMHKGFGWGADGLLTFSIAALALAYFLSPLIFAGRLEAWPAALLSVMVAAPHYAYRLMLGRPYILTMACFMAVLFMWKRRDYQPRAPTLVATALLISLAAWVHGGWYMYWLPAAAFFLAQRWHAGFWMTGCWLAGSLLAGIYTGKPIYYLTQQFDVLVSCFGYTPVTRVLVTEFLPTDGAFTMVAVVVALVIARRLRGEPVKDILYDPAFMMMCMCWVFGLTVRRFWLDWGVVAMLVWLTFEFRALITRFLPYASYNRLVVAGMMCGALALSVSADIDGRWTHNLTKEYLTPETPGIGDWLPEPGGIVYSDNMLVFYDTFHKNPTAPWRYMLGFESTFMPKEDLETYRRIQWNFSTPESFMPWVNKMKPADRMILRRSKGNKPDLPQLEWYYAATDTWIGRVPRAPAKASSGTP